MEEAAAVRQAARDAVDDVEPDRLVERIRQRIDGGSVAPGVLTVLSASAADDAITQDGIAERAAGVQLIYEGLRLTRSLVHEQPWGSEEFADWEPATVAAERPSAGEAVDGKSSAARAADIDVLVADILVARGFYLLARTEAADAAVGVVRSFGRDQTVRRETDDPSLDGNLEADVLELAVVAGTTAAGRGPSVSLREFAIDLADGDDSFPPAETVLTEQALERLETLVSTDQPSPEGARTSADY
jgi:hypothetical protein